MHVKISRLIQCITCRFFVIIWEIQRYLSENCFYIKFISVTVSYGWVKTGLFLGWTFAFCKSERHVCDDSHVRRAIFSPLWSHLHVEHHSLSALTCIPTYHTYSLFLCLSHTQINLLHCLHSRWVHDVLLRTTGRENRERESMTHSLTIGKEQHRHDIREVSTFINTLMTERHTYMSFLLMTKTNEWQIN